MHAKNKDVQHIWAWQNQCFAGKKKMFTTFGAVQRGFALKKTMFNTFGRGKINVSPGKKRCSPHLGLSNDDVPMKKNNVLHIWGCPTMFRRKKKDGHHIWGCPTMFRPEKKYVHHIWGYPMMFRPKKNNVQHIWGCPTTMMYR